MKNQINFSENKILYTNKIFEWIKTFSKEKNFILLSPLTKRSDLFNLNNNSIINKMLLNLDNNIFSKIINEEKIALITSKVNEIFGFNLLKYKISFDKLSKIFFEINDEYVKKEEIENILFILNKYSEKIQNVILIDLNSKYVEKNFNMLNIHLLTNSLFNKNINWSNLERLVMLDWDIPTEIIDKYKFKSWLELETKTFLTIKDINDYFDNKINMNSFLIHKSLQKIKE